VTARFILGVLLKQVINIYHSRWSYSEEVELGVHHNNQSKDSEFHFCTDCSQARMSNNSSRFCEFQFSFYDSLFK